MMSFSKKSSVLLAATLSFFSCSRQDASSLQGGSMTDNGGDTITCRHDAALQASGQPYYEGIYMLDYFLTQDPRVQSNDDLEGQDWMTIHNQVKAFLRDKLPNLYASFQDYTTLLEINNDINPRIWKPSAMALTDLSDEGIIQQLPPNCVVTTQGQTHANLQQMVRRRFMSETVVRKIFYYYDFNKFASLRQNLPLQFDYLVVHEWLWDFVDSPWVNRTINRLIHSKSGQSMTPTQFQDYLLALGVKIEEGTGLIGNVGSQEDPVRASFRDTPLCNYDRRLGGEFLPTGQTVILRPGERRELTLRFPDTSDQVGPKLCGMALMMSHRTVGSSAGQATVNFTLRRGIPQFSDSFTVSNSLNQTSFVGTCRDRLCGLRDGPLNELIFMTSFLGSRWTLELKNQSGAYPVEIKLPYMLFVDMMAPGSIQ